MIFRRRSSCMFPPRRCRGSVLVRVLSHGPILTRAVPPVTDAGALLAAHGLAKPAPDGKRQD